MNKRKGLCCYEWIAAAVAWLVRIDGHAGRAFRALVRATNLSLLGSEVSLPRFALDILAIAETVGGESQLIISDICILKSAVPL